ncbi:MAG: hypothetical protein VX641_05180 [Planctomycetota bacterium]|nr:hypothetical protein [Planctomycetota bacterium]
MNAPWNPLTSTWSLATISLGTTLLLSPVGIGGGGCNNNHGGTIEVHVESPCCGDPSYAREDDLLLRRIVWDDGSEFDDFILASDVRDVEYSGPNNRVRVITGHQCETGDPGVYPINTEDGNGAGTSGQDRQLFADRILNAFNHLNLNAYVHRRTCSDFSCVIEFEETIRDNSPLSDEIGELLVMEVSGNSWIRLEAVDAQGNSLGTPYVIEQYRRISPERLYTRRYSNSGSPLCSYYEWKATGVDLSDLGVNELRSIRVSTPSNAGGSDIKASFRIAGIRTSTVPTAAMVFD